MIQVDIPLLFQHVCTTIKKTDRKEIINTYSRYQIMVIRSFKDRDRESYLVGT